MGEPNDYPSTWYRGDGQLEAQYRGQTPPRNERDRPTPEERRPNADDRDGEGRFTVGDTVVAMYLRINVEEAPDPTEPVQHVLGTDDEGERALQLIRDGEPTEDYITLDDGVWARVTRNDGETVEGPANRENIVSELSTADRVKVVDYDDTPLTGEMRHPSMDDRTEDMKPGYEQE